MDDVAAVTKLFAAFDRNADGFISRDELVEHCSKLAAPGALLRQLNAQTVEAAAEALLKRVDADAASTDTLTAAQVRMFSAPGLFRSAPPGRAAFSSCTFGRSLVTVPRTVKRSDANASGGFSGGQGPE